MGAGYSLLAVPLWLKQWPSYMRAGYEARERAASEESGFGSLQAWRGAEDQRGRSVLITGVNTGLGRECAREMAMRMATVHLLCRSAERGGAARDEIVRESGNANVLLHVVDVASFAAVRAFAEQFNTEHGVLDVLVNNAGVIATDNAITADGVESTLAVMLGGSFLLTALLLPSLRRGESGHVVNVCSAGMFTVKAEPDDLQMGARSFDPMLQFARVKRVQGELTELWAERLRHSNVVVNAMHPGYAATRGTRAMSGVGGDKSKGGFYRQHGSKLRTAVQGADTMVWLACCPPRVMERTGLLYFDRQPAEWHLRKTGTSLKADEAERLWSGCEELCGVKDDLFEALWGVNEKEESTFL